MAGPTPTLDTLLEALGRVYVCTDTGLRIRSFSERLPDLVDRRAADLRGAPLANILTEERPEGESTVQEVARTGDRREGVRAFLLRADGTRLPVSLTAARVPTGTAEETVVLMLRPEEEGGRPAPGHPGIVARSPAMQRIFRLLELLRDHDSTVLITGESGTGKELVARAVHDSSHRAARPFVAVNCAALPSELLESELFGHVRGAFTGAVRDRVGRFEAADGGTLFLDEIGAMALPLQAKILRALQQQTFERVGDTRTRRVDVRVVAATNENLGRAVAEHRFREDLYYRLRVVPIELPPLRQRREDIEPLVRHLLDRIGAARGRALRLSPSAMDTLVGYGWPGNVRELENALEFATTVCEGQTIHVRHLPVELRAAAGPAVEGGTAGEEAMPPAPPAVRATPSAAGAPALPTHLGPAERAEAMEILDALGRARWARAEAARLLGMSRSTLWRKMKMYGLG